MERDRALILTALLAGLRADELVRANVGDLRRSHDGAVIRVRGKGGKDRRIPIESALVEVIERYLDSRATRFPAAKRRSSPGGGLAAWALRNWIRQDEADRGERHDRAHNRDVGGKPPASSRSEGTASRQNNRRSLR